MRHVADQERLLNAAAALHEAHLQANLVQHHFTDVAATGNPGSETLAAQSAEKARAALAELARLHPEQASEAERVAATLADMVADGRNLTLSLGITLTAVIAVLLLLLYRKVVPRLCMLKQAMRDIVSGRQGFSATLDLHGSES